jgi:hypothetical protein
MEDGLFQLLFILFFIMAAIFDAVARSRAKRRRMEEMEGAEGEEDVSAGADAEARSRRRAEREREHRERIQARRKAPDGTGGEVVTRGETGGGGVQGEGVPERETADSMVPEDFWAILTGQPTRAPDTASERNEPEPRAEREWEPDRRDTTGAGAPDPGGGRRSDPDPPRDARTPVPISPDRWGMGGGEKAPRTVAEAPEETRRSSRWMEGVGGRDDSSRWTEGGTEGVHEQEERVYRLPPEPWGALEDISSGEIADGRGRVQSAAAVGPDAAPVRRGVGRGTYTRLLETGDIRDLRKAIVIREVLGTPVGFREEEADRGAW